MRTAKVVYGSENYDFYVNVCKAFGTMVKDVETAFP
jgi:hypothetical protein